MPIATKNINAEKIQGNLDITSVTSSFTGSYIGNGAGLYNIPAAGIVGLNLSQISSGSVSASIDPVNGLRINTNVTAISFTGSFTGSYVGSGAGLYNIPASGITGLNLSQISSGSVSASISPDLGLQINTDTFIAANLSVSPTASGNAFKVESMNPSAGRFAIDENGRVGIGVAPNGGFRVYINSTDCAIAINAYASMIGIFGTSDNTGVYGSGITGVYGEADGKSNGIGVEGIAYDTSAAGSTTNIGGKFTGTGSINNYAVQLQDGTEGINKILVSTTADGKANWSSTITASLFGTASWAQNSVTASYLLGGVASASYAATASYLLGGVASASFATTASYAATASYVNLGAITLINPIVQYYDTTSSILAGSTVTLPGGLTFVSSSQFEYIEIFINGLRLRYDRDFLPISSASVQYQLSIPAGSEITYKSLYR
jgi:hypothetical protein